MNMGNVTIYVSDRVRMHPNAYTDDGLGIAIEPFLSLPLDVSDKDLLEALTRCLNESRSGIPHRPWEPEETTAYYRKLGVKDQKALGKGLDVVLEETVYTLTPIDLQGRFGEPVETGEAELVDRIREELGLTAVTAGE